MLVKIYDVRVPDSTTRFFQVPAYDIPIIKRLWQGRLRPDYLGNQPSIEVNDHGVVEGRQLHNEKIRIRRDYGVQPDGAKLPAWEEIYKNDADFEAAYHREIKIVQAMQAKAKAAPVEEEEEGELVGSVPAPAAGTDLFQPAAGRAPRRRQKA